MSRRGNLHVFETPAAVASALADRFAQASREAIGTRGAFHVALAGGRTPRAAYELLASRGKHIDWQRVFVYFSDERCVPPEDDASNYNMAFDALLSKVPIPSPHVRRMHGEEEPARAARAYAQLLIETMGELPRFDLMLLGMGEDGHTASLFPGSDPRTDEGQLVRAPFVATLGAHRLTVTPLVINASRTIAIAVEGERKAATLAAVFNEPDDLVKFPVQAVAPRDGELEWLADTAAAAKLAR